MSAESEIYSFEIIFAQALQAVLTAREIKCFTILDTPDLQKDRPRTEVVFTPGPGQGRWKYLNNEPRETCWKGTYALTLFTNANHLIHAAYVSTVRAAMQGIGGLINEVAPMTRHKLQPFFKDGGTSPRYAPEEGVYETRMSYEVDFSVQDSAWAALTT